MDEPEHKTEIYSIRVKYEIQTHNNNRVTTIILTYLENIPGIKKEKKRKCPTVKEVAACRFAAHGWKKWLKKESERDSK